MREWTDEEDEKLALHYADGICVTDICTDLKRPKGAVVGRAFRLKLKHPAAPRTDVLPGDMSEDVAAYSAGAVSLSDIARKHKASLTAVIYRFRRDDIPLRAQPESVLLYHDGRNKRLAK